MDSIKAFFKNLYALRYIVILFSLPIIAIISYEVSRLPLSNAEAKIYSEARYTKIRLVAAQIKHGESSISDITKLIDLVKQDQEVVDDFKRRGLIGPIMVHSNLEHFYSFKKAVASSNPDMWIDFSTQEVNDGVYTVDISAELCDELNEYAWVPEWRVCLDNQFTVDLLQAARTELK